MTTSQSKPPILEAIVQQVEHIDRQVNLKSGPSRCFGGISRRRNSRVFMRYLISHDDPYIEGSHIAENEIGSSFPSFFVICTQDLTVPKANVSKELSQAITIGIYRLIWQKVQHCCTAIAPTLDGIKALPLPLIVKASAGTNQAYTIEKLAARRQSLQAGPPNKDRYLDGTVPQKLATVFEADADLIGIHTVALHEKYRISFIAQLAQEYVALSSRSRSCEACN